MQLVNIMMIPKHKLLGFVLLTLPFFCYAQENSPYSRYGIGNIFQSSNIVSRGMGGISGAFTEGRYVKVNGELKQIANSPSINFNNPATYAYSALTFDPTKYQAPVLFDVGTEYQNRTLKSNNPVSKYSTNNLIFSYVQIGVPLTTKKMAKKDMALGLNFGLRPVTRINYKIEKFGRLSGIDSLQTIYEGNGGLNEAYTGLGLKIKNFSIGFNTGYLFGNKDYSTRLIFINDTVSYHASNSATKTYLGGLFFNAGILYTKYFKKGNDYSALRIGAYGNLSQSYNASQDVVRETFVYNSTTGNPDRVDSVYESVGQKGKVQLPATYGVGITYENKHWIIGADFEATNWSTYRFYGATDAVKNNWTAKAGVQYFPAADNSRKYLNFVKYRAGFYFGPDYINVDSNLPQYGITLGGGFPLKLKGAF